MKKYFFSLLVLMSLCFACSAKPKPVTLLQEPTEQVKAPTVVSPLGMQYAKQLETAGCVTLTGNAQALTVTVSNCECFENPNSAASVKLLYLSAQPDVTIVNNCN